MNLLLKRQNNPVALGFLLVFASFTFNAYQYWPGWIDGDGSAMVWEAHYGWFESYLPIVMTGIIRIVFLSTVASLVSVLLFQLGFAYLILLIVLRWQKLPWSYALISTAILMILPPVSSYAGTIVKDFWFSWAAVLGTTALLASIYKKRWAYWPIWIISAALAISFRTDGLAWLISVFGIVMFLLIYQRMFREVAVSAFSMVCIFLLFTLLPVMIGKIVTVEKRYSTQQIMLFDLAALSLEQNDLLIPDLFNPNKHELAFIEERFNPTSNMTILNWGAKDKGFALVHDKKAQDHLKSAWMEAIKTSPYAYLKHRIYIARQFLFGYPKRTEWFWFKYKTSPNVFEEVAPGGRIRDFWQEKVLNNFEGSLLNQLWPYLILSIVSCFIIARINLNESLFSIVLASSSLSYSLAFSLVAPNIGFRYYYFPVVCSFIVSSIAIFYVIQKGRRSGSGMSSKT